MSLRELIQVLNHLKSLVGENSKISLISQSLNQIEVITAQLEQSTNHISDIKQISSIVEQLPRELTEVTKTIEEIILINQ